MHADMAECSDSQVIISASISPLSARSAIFSTMGVCGVIGYMAITSGRQRMTPYDTA
ncbi:MAG: hypothetical protein BWY79_01221 [Actinobacteria bacterium ADurb.Bin444]|nr:MAG: hypothetical protein BWY79_01221 [Actinobacteria bacterium ADurb.Bin444]